MFNLNNYIKIHKPVYLPYLTVGDPSFEHTVKFAVAMIDAGARLLELGIPFSDPTADGPVIQAAMKRALTQKDFSLKNVFSTIHRIHKKRPEIPLIFLTYLNPVMTGFDNQNRAAKFDPEKNIESFQIECKKAGICGVIIPDLPYDQPENIIFRKTAKKYDIHNIMLIAPNTADERFIDICRYSSGFIYYVTSLGVTGERKVFSKDLEENIKRIKKISGLPVLAGFGFTKPEQTRPLLKFVDGIIVGSLNHSIIEQRGKDAGDELISITKSFVRVLNT